MLQEQAATAKKTSGVIDRTSQQPPRKDASTEPNAAPAPYVVGDRTSPPRPALKASLDNVLAAMFGPAAATKIYVSSPDKVVGSTSRNNVLSTALLFGVQHEHPEMIFPLHSRMDGSMDGWAYTFFPLLTRLSDGRHRRQLAMPAAAEC